MRRNGIERPVDQIAIESRGRNDIAVGTEALSNIRVALGPVGRRKVLYEAFAMPRWLDRYSQQVKHRNGSRYGCYRKGSGAPAVAAQESDGDERKECRQTCYRDRARHEEATGHKNGC